MLKNNNLAQLKQLKQQMEDAKEYAEGTVKSTQRRFGFVVLDDGREVFLSPELMEKVFPGDRVNIQVLTNAKGKTSADLLKVIDSPLTEFTGRYVVKGKGHFVEPDLPRFNRWIFIPPTARNGAKDGDYISCKISRHAFPSAKPQAKVLAVIGPIEQPGIEAHYMASKFKLGGQWPKDWQNNLIDISNQQRSDLSHIAFVTIDAKSTLDMDDALFAERTEQGWLLYVAIADPAALIPPGSPLDKEAERRATSVYMPGHTITMLPEELSNHRCSLAANKTRPALVCQIQIDLQGNMTSYDLIEAMVCSQAKLSYQDVAAYLDHDDNKKPAIDGETTIKVLSDVVNALRSQRERDHLVVNNRPEFTILLNEQLKIDRIEEQAKSSAHILVEECMVAANRCAANFMGDTGLFSSHAGFRPERLEGITKLIEEQLGITGLDAASPDGYRKLINAIEDDKIDFPIRSVLSRMLERGQLSITPKPHVGMGLPHYTTFTSPIRKYSDLLVHRAIKAKLNNESVTPLSQAHIDSLQESLTNARQARHQMEQWLKCQFIAPMLNQPASGTISQINSNGFTVRLDNGIEGFVETRLLPEKYSFDPLRLRLTSKSLVVQLDQSIDIVVQEVDSERRSIRFTLPPAVTLPDNNT